MQPAARAGATLQAIWLAGQFQGVISPHTPTGSRRMRVLPWGFSNTKSCNALAVVRKWNSPEPAWPLPASAFSGAPISAQMAWAMSS